MLASLLVGCGERDADGTWELPNGDLAGTRAAAGASIDAGNVVGLEVRWRYALTAKPNYSGTFASTPVADDETVYVQDLQSNVHALERATGKLRWVHRYRALNEGPNGLAVDSRRVYGATDSDAFALSAATGRQLWSRHLTSATEQFVDIAPVVWEGLVFTSTVGFPPGGRGAIYALDAATGVVRWKFVTIREPWRHPLEAGGGGLWYPVSVDAEGRLYAGNSNPQPWGGSPERPNGAAFPGPVPYTNSLLVFDARSGRLLWHDQVTPHDIRDYDFEATPILATVEGEELVFGAGKAGRVIAWDRETRRRRWATAVGLHRNDRGPLPPRRVIVCPGLFGGVLTPMAYAEGRLFVPVVDLCGWGSATGRQDADDRRPLAGKGPARRPRRRDRARALGPAAAVAQLRLRDGLERRRLHVHLRRDRLRVRGGGRRARLAHADEGRGQRVPCRARRPRPLRRRSPTLRGHYARARRVRPALTQVAARTRRP